MLQAFGGTISDIVKADYRAADVFKKYHINFCCSGLMSLQDACALKALNYNQVVQELQSATMDIYLPGGLQPDQWRLDFLIDYMINIHHAFESRLVVSIEETIVSFMKGHGDKYPELERIAAIFRNLSLLVKEHVQHEEEVIFPYIRQIDNAHRRRESYGKLLVRTLRKPLSAVENEHDQISELLAQLQSATNNFTFPIKACTNHQVLYRQLQAFHDELIRHQYMEAIILFPKAIEVEKQLLGSLNKA